MKQPTYDTRRRDHAPRPYSFYTPRVLGRRFLRFKLTLSGDDRHRIAAAAAHGRAVQVTDTVTGLKFRVRAGVACDGGCNCDAVAEQITE